MIVKCEFVKVLIEFSHLMELIGEKINKNFLEILLKKILKISLIFFLNFTWLIN